jgi:predicted lipoprotein with Yx(FWY)xxD motif
MILPIRWPGSSLTDSLLRTSPNDTRRPGAGPRFAGAGLGLVLAIVFGLVPQVAGAQSAPTVMTRVAPTLGTILTDRAGATLYTYAPDTSGVSTCYDECASAWPPVVVVPDVVQAPSNLGANLGLTTRHDGTQQLTYNGMPLYRFVADRMPGDIHGQGVDNVWFVVTTPAQ